MTDATAAIRFLEQLAIPEGPRAGQKLRLAPFQKQFVRGALRRDTDVAALSIARGNAKTALAAGLALGGLVGAWDTQPRREVIIAARTRDQAAIAFRFAEQLSRSLPDETQRRLIFRRSPRLQIEDEADGSTLEAIAADARSALGGSPTLVVMDERAAWPADRGDALEHALLTGTGKRGGRALIISTSAADDAHPFSRWLDEPRAGVYPQEHRPAPGLPADDRESLLIANPGAAAGIGASLEWLEASARRAIDQGGSSLTSFRLLNRNERISGEARDVLLTVDQWLQCETDEPPARSGPCAIGLDLGGSASMSAAAWFWPETGRLECHGWWPKLPTLAARGAADGVSGRYLEMQRRGELSCIGNRVVPAGAFLMRALELVDGEKVAAIACDRYRQAEMEEAVAAANCRVPIVWRGQGFRDGSEDVERFRKACLDGAVRSEPSLLLRSAIADAVCLRDPAGNAKLAKGRSTGRIDAAAAAVLAVAEGARLAARPRRTGRAPVWA